MYLYRRLLSTPCPSPESNLRKSTLVRLNCRTITLFDSFGELLRAVGLGSLHRIEANAFPNRAKGQYQTRQQFLIGLPCQYSTDTVLKHA